MKQKRAARSRKKGARARRRAETSGRRAQLVELIRRVLPEALLGKWQAALGLKVRDRLLRVPLVLQLLVMRHLEPGGSLRKAMKFLAPQVGTRLKSLDGSALCQAGKRLPVRFFQLAARQVGAAAARGAQWLYRGLRVGIVDGTTSSLQNSEANRRTFGRAGNQHARSRYPVLRWVLLLGGAAKSVVDAAFAPYGVSEVPLVEMLLERLAAGWLVLGDRLMCSWRNLATSQGRGSHLLVRQHVSRKGKRYRGAKIRERWEVWHRPRVAGARRAHQLASLPETLEVRIISVLGVRKGWRAQRIELCTTLLDGQAYPAEELAELYLERWKVELVLRTLKSEYGLDWLRSKSPRAVARELYSGLLAYNLVCQAMAESGAEPGGLSPERVRSLVFFAIAGMAWTPGRTHRAIYQKLLVLVAATELRRQVRPPEPRLLARDPRRGWQMLRVPRGEWKAEYVVA